MMFEEQLFRGRLDTSLREMAERDSGAKTRGESVASYVAMADLRRREELTRDALSGHC